MYGKMPDMRRVQLELPLETLKRLLGFPSDVDIYYTQSNAAQSTVTLVLDGFGLHRMYQVPPGGSPMRCCFRGLDGKDSNQLRDSLFELLQLTVQPAVYITVPTPTETDIRSLEAWIRRCRDDKTDLLEVSVNELEKLTCELRRLQAQLVAVQNKEVGSNNP
jgi:hypothetical protein